MHLSELTDVHAAEGTVHPCIAQSARAVAMSLFNLLAPELKKAQAF